ncbi:hypothetical protein KFE25_005298 [Diacronema lutheri]|uniref:Uncharacterized protein n=1 Tax=Diacronema lutheri TaxID=2081491 RepID=A0A8J6CFK3_DIALT|nr:hypothetical protein KFE25_005298 [Diacronema lutheri]
MPSKRTLLAFAGATVCATGAGLILLLAGGWRSGAMGGAHGADAGPPDVSAATAMLGQTLGQAPRECGEWGTVPAETLATYQEANPPSAHAILAYMCARERTREEMPPPSKGAITAKACRNWCEKEHKPPKSAKDVLTGWCCELRNETSCAWTDGKPALTQLPLSAAGASAFEPCPPAGQTEYRCSDNALTDAMALDGDAVGLCSQICLPPSLWKVAQRHGVTQGTCAEHGMTAFRYVASRAGVKYNVYAVPEARR